MLALLLLLASSDANANIHAGAELEVLAYNVLCCDGAPSDTVKVISDVDADIVLLQEVTPRWQARLEKNFAKRYPHRRYAARPGAYGYAILSRVPIGPLKLITAPGGPPAAACAITDTKIAVCSLHLKSARSAFQEKRANMLDELDANMTLRKAQWAKLLAWLDANAKHAPHILAGDTNTPDFDPVLGTLTERHVDAASKVALFPAATYPRDALLKMRLDYVLVSNDVEVAALEVLDEGGSDHLPVVARVRPPRPAVGGRSR